jgi:hypothetical protein
VINDDGGDPAPVINAGDQHARKVVGEVGRCLHMHLGRQQQPGERDGPQVFLWRAGWEVAHGSARLGPEVLHDHFLHDHFLHAPVPAVCLGDRFQRGHAVGLGVADADQDPGSERDRQFTRGARVASRRSGCLSGAPRCAARSGRNDSIIIPWLAVTSRIAASSSRCNAPALACGSNPVW